MSEAVAGAREAALPAMPAKRFEPVEGRALVHLPPFRLEDRRVEQLSPGAAELWVVVPAYDEAAGIGATLDALARLAEPVVACVVDNDSRDGTAHVVRRWAAGNPGLPLWLVEEPEKGTGAAADTGMRFAIARGARLLARTDADCVPDPAWATRLRSALDGGLDLVVGRIVPRLDGPPVRRWEPRLIDVLTSLGELVGRVRPSNRNPAYRTRFRICIGGCLGIRASVYEAAGGFPRSRIEEIHEDRALMNRVRRVTPRIGTDRQALVAADIRRLRAYGLVGILRWYLDHGGGNGVVDVR